MGSGDPPVTDRPISSQEFASTLADLKQTGAAVLLVGDVPQSVSDPLRKRLFGAPGSPPRQRIHVSTSTEHVPPFPIDQQRIDPARWALITYATERRNVAQPVSPPSGPMTDFPIAQECTVLSELGITISDSIADMEATCDGFAPAQLRVGFDSISPILENEESTAFRFLHLLIERITAVDGMIHCPLHYSLDSRLVRLYEPLFDAIIELRVNDGEAQQRWHFTSRDVHSAWLSASM